MDAAGLVADLDDVSIAGSPAAGASTFKRFMDAEKGLSSIGAEVNIGKCRVHGGDMEEGWRRRL